MLIIRNNMPQEHQTIYWAYIQAIGTVIAIMVAAIGLMIDSMLTLHIQAKEAREARNLQESQFLLDLNRAFAENPDYQQVYTYLEYEYFSSDAYKGVNPYPDGSVVPSHITRIQISNYLTFFESIYLLIEQNTINLGVIDNLFGYRFFLAVHSQTIQKEKLLSTPKNFRNIYRLENKWMEYRLSVSGKESIFNYDNNLKQALINKFGKEKALEMYYGELAIK